MRGWLAPWQKRWIALTVSVFLAAACTTQASTLVATTSLPPLPTLDPARIRKGKELYQAHCASCHGVQAEGAPNWATPEPDGLYPAPPHDDTGHTWHHSDRVLYEAIYGGMSDPLRPGSPLRMPAWGSQLSDAEIRVLIEYFQSLWSEDHRCWQREQTLNDFAPMPTPSP